MKKLLVSFLLLPLLLGADWSYNVTKITNTTKGVDVSFQASYSAININATDVHVEVSGFTDNSTKDIASGIVLSTANKLYYKILLPQDGFRLYYIDGTKIVGNGTVEKTFRLFNIDDRIYKLEYIRNNKILLSKTKNR